MLDEILMVEMQFVMQHATLAMHARGALVVGCVGCNLTSGGACLMILSRWGVTIVSILERGEYRTLGATSAKKNPKIDAKKFGILLAFFAAYNINYFSKLPKSKNFNFSLEFYLQCKHV